MNFYVQFSLWYLFLQMVRSWFSNCWVCAWHCPEVSNSGYSVGKALALGTVRIIQSGLWEWCFLWFVIISFLSLVGTYYWLSVPCRLIGRVVITHSRCTLVKIIRVSHQSVNSPKDFSILMCTHLELFASQSSMKIV